LTCVTLAYYESLAAELALPAAELPKLVEGAQNIRINAPSQRGVTLHSFDIKPKAN
jgi:hypothetical protein